MYARDIDIPAYSKTKKLRLVTPDPKYAPITIKWISQDEVTQYLGTDFSKMTIDDEVDHLKNMIDDDNRYSWMIERDGEIVGNVEINEIKELSEKYGVKTGAFCTLIGNPDDWGQGLGSYAKQAACNWAFSEGGFQLIEAKAYVQNVRSWGALEKLGYHYEGIENGEVEGAPVEWKVYTLKKADWEQLNWPVKQNVPTR
jgi:RimJ/RimL family protein N-acetyltransferase